MEFDLTPSRVTGDFLFVVKNKHGITGREIINIKTNVGKVASRFIAIGLEVEYSAIPDSKLIESSQN